MAADELPPNLATKEDLEKRFQSVVVDVLLSDLRSSEFSSVLTSAIGYIEVMVKYTTKGGKFNRGVFLVQTAQIMIWTKEKRELTEDEMVRAIALAWCLEVLQASFLVADDVMDQGEKRRGFDCWYRTQSPLSDDKNDKVGVTAVNDTLILESVVYILLKHYFGKDLPRYVQLTDLFHKVAFQTELGQLLDLTSQPRSASIDLAGFNIDLYRGIVLFKTSFYSFYLPVAAGLIFAGESAQETLDAAKAFLLPLGEYFQIQDDYLDCYGDPALIGKVGRDVEEKKCSWLVVKAVEFASDEQKELLKKHYGTEDPADVKIIKDIFASLELKEVFKKYEEESFVKLQSIIDGSSLPKVLLNVFLQKIYKRTS
mmetsp:Transcript_26170/g.36410  ORF Transcript_26170/g.36410 Transcript_26170/m.36410 type:complete len:369 (+) Transcript_26170:102-1208(+)|eukprot:CAMPEP_0201482542 /NCGR_PEP_ID=MMETSP0151_2-20130828/6819_1 /ASSEMBLY_ACC=CAM_ASM_000257 /TAXON_ID=200890 /ORGANISM="Paramoeba atlantica, Strain 621/1 / CCAP 1560/9" /LENGTH=368 /DNA_ID=CAMNT_0047865291 /DNA_START=102 /DNA_END=1208 /DNA_ORIENTATION=-